MGKITCPSCGAPYNGKRCRSCNYEHFSEEIAHGNHTHKGEPLVIDSPVRKPVPKKDPFGCDRKIRRKHPLVRFLILLYLIYSLMPLFRDWGLKLEAMEESRSAVSVQPEPVLAPENMVILHREDGITLFTTPEQFADLNDFCLYVHNESGMKVTASAGEIRVNGSMLPHASVVCSARPGEIGKGWLEVDVSEWEAAGIRDIRTLSFELTVLRQDGRIGFETGEICLTTEGAENLWENS